MIQYTAKPGALINHNSPQTLFCDCPPRYKKELEFLASNVSSIGTTVPLALGNEYILPYPPSLSLSRMQLNDTASYDTLLSLSEDAKDILLQCYNHPHFVPLFAITPLEEVYVGKLLTVRLQGLDSFPLTGTKNI